ncbi:hypothetical protein [Microbacterium sp. IEGM 1404]|uniref:hypothetical protein n=1 Tax=Microbacterium sp. IEGM 1404 TaxID=3047084 RepID=UPI0024B7F97B|nr:hypothetical protein [Microbacterium sp. IEGM 1404]MDI9890566.1 hypothetical protein [Microbacterium sp. IEGM 1404]
MDTEAARRLLLETRNELEQARTRVTHLEQVVSGLSGLLEDRGVAVPSSPSAYNAWNGAADGSEVRPREAVLEALRKHPGRLMTVRSIYEWIEQEGLINPEVRSGVAAYDMALRRLAEEPGANVVRDDQNRFAYRPSPSRAAKASSAPNEGTRIIANDGRVLGAPMRDSKGNVVRSNGTGRFVRSHPLRDEDADS